MGFGFTLAAVYYLESQNPNMNPVAIRPQIQNDYVSWEDTGHGRIVRYSQLFFDGRAIKPPLTAPQALPDRIKVVSVKGETYELVKLTLNIFQTKVHAAKKETLNFKSDDDVQKHYLSTDFGG